MADPTALRRFSNIAVNLGFAVAIGLPLMLFSAGPWIDPLEKRPSAPPPQFPVSLDAARAFPGAFEAFFNDHFGLRAQLIGARSRIDFHLFERSPTPRVVLGRENWLFYTGDNSIEDYRGQAPFTGAQLENWYSALKQRRDWLASRGIAYSFVVAPNKQSIYPENMPASIVHKTPGHLDELTAFLARKGDPSLLNDLRPALLARKSTLPLYHPIDTHWNAYGAYIGYRAIAAGLAAQGARGLNVIDLAPGTFGSSAMDSGDLSKMMGFRKAPSPVSTAVYIGSRLPCGQSDLDADPGPIFADAIHMHPDMSSDCTLPEPAGRALVFHDSMIWAMQDYLMNSFSHVQFVRATPSFYDLVRYVEAEHPDVIIEERVERTLPDIELPMNIPAVTISSSPSPSQAPTDRMGWVEAADGGPRHVIVDGWALWQSNAEHRAIAIDTNLAVSATTVALTDRPDVVAALKDQRLAQSGFQLWLDIDQTKPFPDTIRLCIWTDDPILGRHRLNYGAHPEWDSCSAGGR